MLRLPRITAGRFSIIKTIHVSLHLVKASFKTLFFNHNQYAIFCLLLAFVQVAHLELTTKIIPRLPIAATLTEFLDGQNFFEILKEALTDPISLRISGNILLKTVLYFVQSVIMLFISLAAVYFTYYYFIKRPIKIKRAFALSFSKWSLVFRWALIDLLVAIISAVLPYVGDAFEYIWQLATALIVPIIAFEKVSFFNALRRALSLFRKSLGDVISIDIILELVFIVIYAFFHYFYRGKITPHATSLIEMASHHVIGIFVLFYMLAVVMVAELVALTMLYREITAEDN